MVLGKLPVSGRPTNLGESRARAYSACSRCGCGLFGHFFSQLSFLSRLRSRSETICIAFLAASLSSSSSAA